jgi:hypothetical protein
MKDIEKDLNEFRNKIMNTTTLIGKLSESIENFEKITASLSVINKGTSDVLDRIKLDREVGISELKKLSQEVSTSAKETNLETVQVFKSIEDFHREAFNSLLNDVKKEVERNKDGFAIIEMNYINLSVSIAKQVSELKDNTLDKYKSLRVLTIILLISSLVSLVGLIFLVARAI